jgi:hypothetical protein
MNVGELPGSFEEIRRALSSSTLRRVRSYVLGPAGTNIMQAAELWHTRMGVTQKAELVLCDTPEQAVLMAKADMQAGVLAVSWTCAVYVGENGIFFNNHDTLPFFFQQVMPLDEMQLATRPGLERQFPSMFAKWRTLSHPSPAPLLNRLGCSVIHVNSNADAARRCAAGEGEACITTETARKIYGLVKLHNFGSPEMVFFGGICRAGAALLKRAFYGAAVSEDRIAFDSAPSSAAA